MTWFTPIINFDFQQPRKWAKISNLKIKKISDSQLSLFFGISNRELDMETGEITSFTDCPSAYKINLDVLNESQRLELYSCKYAFVSDLDEKEHIEEVEQILTAFRLFCLSGITCPIMFNYESPGVKFIYPLSSPFERRSFSNGELKEISRIKCKLPKVDIEDIRMLSAVIEYGYSTISLLLLITILERNIMRNGNNKSEINFKMRIFVAKLLSKFFHYNEKEVFDNMGSFYKDRSRFVHAGGDIKHSKLRERLPILYDYTVKILLIKMDYPEILNPNKRNNLLWCKV